MATAAWVQKIFGGAKLVKTNESVALNLWKIKCKFEVYRNKNKGEKPKKVEKTATSVEKGAEKYSARSPRTPEKYEVSENRTFNKVRY